MHRVRAGTPGVRQDPATLHGEDMPGLKELAAGAALVTAIHQWFGAQLSKHGADATFR